MGGKWRGRALVAPAGSTTRPTSERVRQAVFDMLLHAPWAGPDAVRGQVVLDGFAGTGALALEALSRGAAHAVCVERDRAALTALRANVASLGADATVIAADVTAIGPGSPCGLVFLDPPYGHGLVAQSLSSLHRAGRIAPGALLVAELARDEAWPPDADRVAGGGPTLENLTERVHGAARVVIARCYDRLPPAR